MTPQGVFNLLTPKDLLGKLSHDMERLEADWLSQYAAFDFFITAHHLHEWLRKSRRSREGRRYEKLGGGLQRICEQIANGSKHFLPKPEQNPDVAETRLHEGPFSQDFSEEHDISRLEIALEGEAAREFGLVITAPTLARRVIAYWRGHPDLS
jgi:hypothetical protein